MGQQPFTISVTLQLPPDGQAATPVQFDFASSASSYTAYKLQLVDTGSKTLDLGTLSPLGAKLLFLKVDEGQNVAPVMVRINEETVGEEVSAGGGKLLVSPSPVTGITAITLEWSAATSVSVWALS